MVPWRFLRKENKMTEEYPDMPDGLIGEAGVGFTKGALPRLIAWGISAWLVVIIAGFTFVRFVHWIVRG